MGGIHAAHPRRLTSLPTSRRAADLVVTGALVRTMDLAGTVARALAVKDGRFVAIGDEAEVTALADGATRRIDARGRVVLPGFTDGHLHLNSAAIIGAYAIDFLPAEPASLADVFAAVRRQAAAVPVGTWIRGDNLNDRQLGERRLPTKRELDAVAPDHPVAIYSVGFHLAAVNTLALRKAGIGRDSVDPPGGHIERDAHGEPTGVLRERAKAVLDPRRGDTILPRFGIDARVAALRKAFDHLLSRGVTSVHDMVVDPEEVRAYHILHADHALPLRVQIFLRGVESQMPLEHVLALGLQSGLGDEWLRIGGIKMSVDGACFFKNAAVYDPYPGEPDNRGIIRIQQDELDEKVLACHQAGLRLCIHAIGQRAVDMALDAIGRALAAVPRAGHRHRIEHAYLPPRPGQLERMAALGVVASTQPSFIYGFGDTWTDAFGPDRLGHVMPLRTMLDLGIPVMFSTDYPCVPVDPFLTLRSAVARLTREGHVLDPSEAISVEEGLRLMTSGPAYGGCEERSKGSIELGKLADLVIVSEDPLAVPAAELHRIQVESTIVGGVIRFQRS